MPFAITPNRALPLRRHAVWVAGLITIATGAWAAPKAVVVEPAHLELGEVEPGPLQKFEWTLRNDGDAVLGIASLEPTCYCTTGKADSWSIAPGQSTKVHVAVDPSDWVGEILKGVEIETNDPDNKHLMLDIKMRVRPGIAVVPPELDFGAVAATGAPARTIDVKTAKERPFKVTLLTSDAAYLAVQQEPLQTDDRVGVKLLVKVGAGAPAGPFAAKVVLETDDAARPRIEIPVRGMGPGGLAADPARILFESAVAGAELGTIKLVGGKGVKITGSKTSSPALETCVRQQPDGSFLVHVNLAANAKPGRVTAKIAIATTDAAQAEIVVPVMGIVK